jgi:hypothetical protein
MAIISASIDSVDTLVLQVPNTSEVAITTMFFCNQSLTTSATIDVHLVQAGQTISPTNRILYSLPLPPTETFVFDFEKIILEGLDEVYAIASVPNIVSATVSYVQTA